MRHLITFLGAAALAGLAAAHAAHAQDAYPARPVRIVVPFSPGTGMDILARTLGPRMADDWKVGVVVDNRPGASGAIGSEMVATAPADGYTLMLTASVFVQSASLLKRLPYDPVRDFAPVLPVAVGRLALVTHPSLQARTATEFIALAKARPGTIYYASPGNGTPHHLAMEVFRSATGIDIVHVPYKSTAGAVQDLLGGQVSVMFLPVHVALPLVEAGKLNMLAAGGAQRAAATPGVPSLKEAAGVTQVDTDFWYGLYAPARTPRDVVARLNAEVNALLRRPDVVEALARQGLQATGGTPEDLEALTRNDLERWTKVVRDAKIQAD